jgi:hypothetical protein
LFDDETRKQYVPFVVNKAMSFSPDTILLANFINTNSHLDLELQHDMYWYTLKKRPKRFQKWPQKNLKNLNIIMRVYQCSEKKALEIQKILTEEQLAILDNIEETFENATRTSTKSSK